MENFENESPAPQETQDWKSQYESLRYLVTSMLVLMVIISGTLNLFLLRQMRYARTDLEAVRPQVTQMVAEYNKTTAPVVNDFARKLVEFGQRNPDFMPIVTKYGLSRVDTNAPAPKTMPAPGPAAAPKK